MNVFLEKEDGLIIDGTDSLEGGIEVWSHKDHRIAMTLAIVATRCKKSIIIKDYECIAKSYPNFFEDYKILEKKTVKQNLEYVMKLRSNESGFADAKINNAIVEYGLDFIKNKKVK